VAACGSADGGPRMVGAETPIAYWEVGQDGATTIVLHGGPGIPHGYLRPEFDRLTAVGRVVYYDQRGCGRSTREDAASWEDHVADLDRLIDRVGGAPVYLAGSSWGSYLALLFAVRHPERVRALVLGSPPPWSWGDRWVDLDDRWERLPVEQREALLRRLISHAERMRAQEDSAAQADAERREADPAYIPRPLPPTFDPVALVPQRIRDSIYGPPGVERDTVSARLRMSGPWNEPERYGVDSAFAARFPEICERGAWITSLRGRPGAAALRQLTTPVLIIEGEEGTPHAGSEELAPLLPNAQVVLLPGAGHAPWYTRPDRFFDEAIRFLSGT
jgi:pimeloyl-ACP methyl ester carboxylesterase